MNSLMDAAETEAERHNWNIIEQVYSLMYEVSWNKKSFTFDFVSTFLWRKKTLGVMVICLSQTI